MVESNLVGAEWPNQVDILENDEREETPEQPEIDEHENAHIPATMAKEIEEMISQEVAKAQAATLSHLKEYFGMGTFSTGYINGQKLLMNHYVDMLKKEIHKFILAKDWKNMDELINAALEREQETKKRERSPLKRRIEQLLVLKIVSS
ncbi:hypothetical protein Tco_0738113 [Tanacetum coccineum]